MMRPSIAAAALVLLAACDDGGVIDQTVRQGARQSAVEACAAWVPQSDIASAAGLDGQRLCGCAVDRMLEAKSLADLEVLRPGSAESRTALAQCVAEIQSDTRAPERAEP